MHASVFAALILADLPTRQPRLRARRRFRLITR